MIRRRMMTTRSVYPQDSEVRDGRLLVGGCDVAEVAKEFGTPAYVYAEKDLRARAKEFKDALAAAHAGPGEVLFASKAFPCTAALRIFAEEGLSVDVASGGELQLALNAGFDPERIYMHGNAKSEAELWMAVDAGVGHIVLDGADPERLERIVPEGRRQKALVRVTPGVAADTHEAIMTGHAESKFGYAPATANAIAKREWKRIDVVGLHVHLGSQIFDHSPFRAALATLAGLGSFPVYDLGGGMAVAYTHHDRPPDIADWVASLVEVAHDLLDEGAKLVIEPGRALVAGAGVTIYTVEDVKRRGAAEGGPGLNFVAVDGGMSDNLRPMLYGAVYEADLAGRVGERGTPYTVVGKHCESGDVLIRGASLPDPAIGDVLVMPVTGAYGHAMASNYNGVLRPPVIFCAEGTARAVVRRETFEDLLGRDA
jgi:diaminopimelate decarboxylase